MCKALDLKGMAGRTCPQGSETVGLAGLRAHLQGSQRSLKILLWDCAIRAYSFGF